jgi:hypothetical protein
MKNKIYENKFVGEILERITKIIKKSPIIKKDIQNFKKGLSPLKVKKSPCIRYDMDVFYRLNNIIDILNDIDNVKFFLKKYPFSKKLKNNKITKTIYTTYHLEVYFIKIAGLRDRLSLLINTVYDLGLPDKEVKIYLLSKMKQLKGSSLIKLLEKFNKELEMIGIVEGRNLIAHNANYDDEKLKVIRMYEMVKDKVEGAEDLADLMMQTYIIEKLKIIKKNKEFVENFLEIFLNEIKVEYDKKLAIMKCK